jgi:predicted RNA methylase
MRLKELVSLLSDVPEFESPSHELEQYKTSAELAADIAFSIEGTFGDFFGRLVLDLGCGTGVFSVAAAALGAALVIGVDVDDTAIEAAREAADNAGVGARVEFILADIIDGVSPLRGAGYFSLASPLMNDNDGTTREGISIPPVMQAVVVAGAPTPLDGISRDSKPVLSLSGNGSGGGGGGGGVGGGVRALAGACGVFDTAILNPPFGTRRQGADVTFLRSALRALTPVKGIAYSLHKSSTRAHLSRLAHSWNVGISLVAQLKFPVPATYAFHRETERDIEVDLLRVTRKNDSGSSILPPYSSAAAAAATSSSSYSSSSSRRRT